MWVSLAYWDCNPSRTICPHFVALVCCWTRFHRVCIHHSYLDDPLLQMIVYKLKKASVRRDNESTHPNLQHATHLAHWSCHSRLYHKKKDEHRAIFGLLPFQRGHTTYLVSPSNHLLMHWRLWSDLQYHHLYPLFSLSHPEAASAACWGSVAAR